MHAGESASVDRNHNAPGSPYLDPHRGRSFTARSAMQAEPLLLDQARRKVVLTAIRETCAIRAWRLSAAHIRSTHVHAIVATKDKPERVLIDLKSYASRGLVKAGLETSHRKKWAAHGSTRWLWEEDELHRAIDYVLNGQGTDMEVHHGPELWK